MESYSLLTAKISKLHVAAFGEGVRGHYPLHPSLYTPKFLRGTMKTYFGDLYSVVDPPERLKVLFMVDPYACTFVSHREIECNDRAVVKGEVEGGEEKGWEVRDSWEGSKNRRCSRQCGHSKLACTRQTVWVQVQHSRLSPLRLLSHRSWR